MPVGSGVNSFGQQAWQGRRDRGQNQVGLCKSLFEILLDQAAYLLCLYIVAFVLPDRQVVGTQHHALLYAGAKAFAAAALVQVVQICRVGAAVTERSEERRVGKGGR